RLEGTGGVFLFDGPVGAGRSRLPVRFQPWRLRRARSGSHAAHPTLSDMLYRFPLESDPMGPKTRSLPYIWARWRVVCGNRSATGGGAQKGAELILRLPVL